MLRPSRFVVLHVSLMCFALALIGRAGQVQLWQRAAWEARAAAQQTRAVAFAASRGEIRDESGALLARTQPAVRLAVAPREVRARDSLASALRALGVPREALLRSLDTARAWVPLPGTYAPAAVRRATSLRGVYGTAVLERAYTVREAMRRVVGAVDAAGVPVSGLELALDTLLRGHAGQGTQERDARGTGVGAGDTSAAPTAGDAVVLTINQTLQEIAERALDSAVAKSGAIGGDLVILDPEDGEIRALVSRRRDPRASGIQALTEPYEPGSTLKPLFAAALLDARRARPDDRVNTERGHYTLAGRTITDEHPAPSLTLREVIRWSSNIGIVKFTSRLTPVEQFGVLRDFGFGMPTGVPFPSEASGTLRPPAAWSRQSAASLAMGYEIAVTPLQLAAAYVAIANGGELLEPALVKEIRSSDGTVRYRHHRRVVRRVVDSAAAAVVRAMMVDVVAGGTATGAGLRDFTLAGKSGTSRRAAPGGHGRYAEGHHTASFVALFPAEHPQYAMLVKLDDPTGQYMGGKAAAPVSKIVLEAALAARDASLDRSALTPRESLTPAPAETVAAPASSAPGLFATGDGAPDGAVGLTAASDLPAVFLLPAAAGARPTAARVRAVPSVRGLPVRAAVFALHRAGFRVALTSVGVAAAGTVPAAGALGRTGDLVRLETAP